MTTKTIFLLLLVVACEIAISQWFMSVAASEAIYYQLAARYSARVSFLLLTGMLCWTGIRGLKFIYAEEQRRKLFVTLLLLLAVNHLIHFYFLAMNFEAKGLQLFDFKNMPGAITYIVLSLSPFYLWNKKELSKGRYQVIITGFVLVIALFVGTYIKRFYQELEIPISKYLLIGNLVVLTCMATLNVFRIWSEKNPSK